MVAEIVTAIAVFVAILAEMLHTLRVRRLALLAFGPKRRPAYWASLAPLLRVVSIGALAWGFTTLFLIAPKVHKAESLQERDKKHVVLVLDVSPSMRLDDAGPEGDQSRMNRASDVLESFFMRVAIEQYRISVVAVYTGAKPVVIDTSDVEVVRNVLNDLPMHYAFRAGETDIFSGLREAARIAKPWKPRSTTVILVSDGDTVPAKGMPKMPASVRDVLVIGIGDPQTGKFINGRQSRQDISTLRQIAIRLKGEFHNGNEKHLSTALLKKLTQTSARSKLEQLTKREYALLAIALGGTILAVLPVLLQLFGSGWKPGVPTTVQGESSRGSGTSRERVPGRASRPV